MALDISALLTSDGGHAQTDRMFTDKTGDMMAVAGMLDAVHYENRRLRTVPAPASRLRNGATYSIPCVRLTKAERRVLVDAITDFGQSISRTTKARKLAGLLASSACVYWSEPFMDGKTTGRVMSTSFNCFSHDTFSALLVLVTG